MVQLVGFAGSLRAGSFNRALLAEAASVMPEGAALRVLAIDEVPLYNGDLENSQGVPPAVESIKDAIAGADGVVIATPEYNGGIPGVAKNVIDWVSRPAEDLPRVTHGKPVALMGATPGGLGTTLSQVAWLQVLRTLRMRVWVAGGPFYVSAAHNSFDENGRANTELSERLGRYMASFVAALS